MVKGDRYLADEIHRTLNRVPLTRATKREIRRNLLKDMDGRRAAQLTLELKARVESLEAVLDVIHRSRDLPCRSR